MRKELFWKEPTWDSQAVFCSFDCSLGGREDDLSVLIAESLGVMASGKAGSRVLNFKLSLQDLVPLFLMAPLCID